MVQHIVGICGPIGSGKTTLADLLQQVEGSSKHYESWLVIAEIASEFNKELADTGWSGESNNEVSTVNHVLKQLLPKISDIADKPVSFSVIELTNSNITTQPKLYEKLFEYLDNIKKHPELLTQPITTENKERYRPLLQWLGGYFAKRIDPCLWYNEIMRRINQECKTTALAIVGGVRFPADEQVVHFHDGYVIELRRPGIIPPDQNDITEIERDEILSDTVVINNGTLTELAKTAKQLYQDLKNNELEPVYVAGKHTNVSPYNIPDLDAL